MEIGFEKVRLSKSEGLKEVVTVQWLRQLVLNISGVLGAETVKVVTAFTPELPGVDFQSSVQTAFSFIFSLLMQLIFEFVDAVQLSVCEDAYTQYSPSRGILFFFLLLNI